MPHPDNASSLPTASPDLSGLWVPLVTPFEAHGQAVDHAALAALTRRVAADGVAGVVVCGSTGEAAALDEAEQDAVLATVRTAAPGLPCIMGLAGSHQPRMLARLRALSAPGAHPPLHGVLLSAPAYVRPSQAGLLDWFESAADASVVPLLVYDIPYRTGATLARETLLALAAHPNIVGLKDCGGDMAKTRAVIADGRLQVLAGEDHQILATLAEGGVGAIAASAHLRTRDFVGLLALLREGRLDAARAAWQGLLPLVEALFAEPNPGPVKALLARRGEMSEALRAPMTPASAALAERLVRLESGLSRP